MTILDDPTIPTPRFSDALRAATWADHRAAERAPFVRALVAGEVDRAGYAAMVDQHWHIYSALEHAAHDLREDDVVAAFVTDDLARLPHLEADLAALRGPAWRELSRPLPATTAYCARIGEVARSWPGGFVAHHYTRYLGDLSGGQFLGRVAQRTYGFTGAGAAFYRFEAIEDPAAFREEYRRRLDRAGWDAGEQARIIEEIGTAYHHNTALFEDLAVHCGVTG